MKKDAFFKRLCVFLLLLLTLFSMRFAGFQFSVLASRGGRFFDMLEAMFPPDSAYFPKIAQPILDTVRMSLAGTALGMAAGLAAAPLCAATVNRFAVFRCVLRLLIQILRAVPALVLALACTFLFGIGSFAGTAALSVYTFAIMTKQGYEEIENAPMQAYAALMHSGCGKFRAFWRGILPFAMPPYLSNGLYLLETNVRNAAILGYVGAGGIGLLLNEKIAWREYTRAGAILCLLFLTVSAIELCSEYLREKLQGGFQGRKYRCAWLGGIFLLLWCVAGTEPPSGAGIAVARSMAEGLLHPSMALVLDFSRNGLPWLLLETFCIALAGTVIGAAFSLPLAFLTSAKLMPKGIALLTRLFLMAVRTVPVFLYGLMFIRVTGPGSFAGLLTLALCSVGLLTKRFLTAIDNLNLGAYNAFRDMGIPLFARIRYGILPQLLPHFATAVFYRFDINLREASVLGLVGAGGVGAPLIFAMNQYKWREAGAILLGLILLICMAELLSGSVRRHFWRE